jgi:phage terminase small subunit
MEIKKPLLKKRRDFCLMIVKGYSGVSAARQAGYKESNLKNTACLLMAKPDVKEEIKRLMSEVSDQLEIDETFVWVRVKKLADHKDPNIAMKAVALTAQLLGMQVKKVDVNVNSQDSFVKNLYGSTVENNS